MVIETVPGTADQSTLDKSFNDPTSLLSQQLEIISELVDRRDQLRLDDVVMDDRFEAVFRAYGGAEYGFKQIAADVLTRNSNARHDHGVTPLIDGKAAMAISELKLERERIITQLSAAAGNLEKLVAFERALADQR